MKQKRTIKNRLTAEQIAFIEKNFRTMTTGEMAEKIGQPKYLVRVYCYRKNLDVKRGKYRPGGPDGRTLIEEPREPKKKEIKMGTMFRVNAHENWLV